MIQRNWNWQRRVEHWLRASVGAVLRPIFGFFYFVCFAVWLLCLFGFVAAANVFYWLRRGRRGGVRILRRGELRGRSDIIEIESKPEGSGERDQRSGMLDKPVDTKANLKGRVSFRVLPSAKAKGITALIENVMSREARTFCVLSSSRVTYPQRASQEMLRSFRADLALCATTNGVFALVEDCYEGLWAGFRIESDFVEVTLQRLAEVAAEREQTKRVLALFGLDWIGEGPVDERVVKLRCDEATGAIAWNDKAATSIYFERWGGTLFSRIMARRADMRVSVMFNENEKLVSWRFWVSMK